MRIRDYITADRIILDLDGATKNEVLGQLVERLATSLALSETETILGDVIRRESVMSTGIGDGIAIPHAAAAGLEAPAITIGISPAGIDFDAVDGRPVHVFFLLIGSQKSPGLQLKALARIARLTRRPALVAGLRSAGSAEEVLATLGREDEETQEWPPPRADSI